MDDENLVKKEEVFEINFKYEVPEHENLNASESSDIKIEIVDWQQITEEEENVTANNSESTESFSRPPSTKLSRVTPTLCSLCNTGFPNRQLYEDHVDKLHRDELPHRCRFCKKRFKDKGNTKKHEKIHDKSRFSGPGSFECDICGKLYHLKDSLRVHRNQIHLGIAKRRQTASTVVRQLHTKTGVKYPNRRGRKMGEEEYPCPNCRRTFPHKSALKEHMTQHTDERPFSCRYCGKSYKFQSSMKHHVQKAHEQGLQVRKHRTKMEPIPCSICGKSFNVPSHLQTHMYLHTGGDLPHKCTLCEKKYRFANELRHHLAASHKSPDTSGLRVFECRICGKPGFRTPPEILRHIGKVHGYKITKNGSDSDSVKPFACGICGKPFYLGIGAVICAVLCHDPSSLQKKMFRHKCPYCPDHFGFHCLSLFRKHVESEHPHEPVPRNVKNSHYYKDSFKKLPSVTWDKKRREELRWGMGMPQEVLQSPFPLYVKLEKRPELHCSNKPLKLYEPEIKDEITLRKIKRKRKTNIDPEDHVDVPNDRCSNTVICKMCGESFLSSRKFSNHENACKNKFKIRSTISLPRLFPHQETHDSRSFALASPDPRLRRNRVTKEIVRLFQMFKPDMARVIVSDSAAVRRILNFQSVSVCLTRLRCRDDD